MTDIYTVKTPAKLNLRLKVTGRRADGYHELVSIMVPVGLCDLLTFSVLPREGVELECDGYRVPCDAGNLVYMAAQAFFERTGIREGISIRLTKNIPVAAGMGGGSSDAAAALKTLNRIWSAPLPHAELEDMALKLGADVPFFLECMPSLATGVGEILEPLEWWPEIWYVIVTPPVEVSTSWVYSHLRLELTQGEYDFTIKQLREHFPFSVSKILENDLENVTIARYPVIDAVKRRLRDAGAEGALMTGSGPSVFGLFSTLESAVSAQQDLISQDLGDIFVAGNWEEES
ncbi:MAG: 4-(cytidine 5'-diphospho)-2-C-methyl-D-erythritol kinase [Deltaproteobacteria bacterium]|nr:4-(cytidine 5'-diphospho)-2-C-methyl-D-erythritol kinase [Deltaproteobacteria bacterium]